MVSYDKVLPIGTVVLLKGAQNKLMILGYQRMAAEGDDKIYDYCGCPYPEGYISPAKTVIFDHALIDRIYAMGLQNDEGAMFEGKLRAVIQEREAGPDEGAQDGSLIDDAAGEG